MRIEFGAQELNKDGNLGPARYSFEESRGQGWVVRRENQAVLRLGQGYRLLRVAACGVCATDLARQHLPFPLPQVIGHEVLARDEEGKWYVVEINASHLGRGLSAACPYCEQGLASHCPDRLVLGIHDLPGGFGAYILAPSKNVIAIPRSLSLESAVLIEPLAAALSAVRVIQPREGSTIAVLGPRRLGMLVIAALAAYRRQAGLSFNILGLCRRERLMEFARNLGADSCMKVGEESTFPGSPIAQTVVDTTGSPAGLELALSLADQEVHLKSTHGMAAGGLKSITGMVVDEVSLRGLPEHSGEGFDQFLEPVWPDAPAPRTIAWLAQATPPQGLESGGITLLRDGSAMGLLERMEKTPPENGIPRADLAVVDRLRQIDEVLRPADGRETSLVKPRGAILVDAGRNLRQERGGGSVLWDAITSRGLKVTTSRCGDFRAALELMSQDPGLACIGERMITHRFGADQLGEALEAASSRECIKTVVVHDQSLGW